MQCEAAVTEYDRASWTFQCTKPAKYEVVGQLRTWSGEPEGEPRTIHVCGIHKRTSDKNGRVEVFARTKDGFRDFALRYYTSKTEEFIYKERLEKAEQRKQWALQVVTNVSKFNHSTILHTAMRILRVVERGPYSTRALDTDETQAVGFLREMRDQYDTAWQKYLEACDEYDAIVREKQDAEGD